MKRTPKNVAAKADSAASANLSQREKATREFIGIRKQPADAPDAVEIVRNLRRGNRLDTLRDK